MGAGHVLGDSGRPVRAQAAAMAGDPFAAMKDLDCRGNDPSAGLSSCSKSARRLVPQPRIKRSFSSSSRARMAALSSASEKKRRCRNRARIQRPTTWTPTSTLALSRGL